LLAVDRLPELLVTVAQAHPGNHGRFLLRLNKLVVLFLHLRVLIHHGDLGFPLLRNLNLMNRLSFERGLAQAELTDFFNITDTGYQRLLPQEFSVTGVFVALGHGVLVLEEVG